LVPEPSLSLFLRQGGELGEGAIGMEEWARSPLIRVHLRQRGIDVAIRSGLVSDLRVLITELLDDLGFLHVAAFAVMRKPDRTRSPIWSLHAATGTTTARRIRIDADLTEKVRTIAE
jgi:hypothetical protein